MIRTTRPEHAAPCTPRVGSTGGASITQPLRDEHAALQPFVRDCHGNGWRVGACVP